MYKVMFVLHTSYLFGLGNTIMWTLTETLCLRKSLVTPAARFVITRGRERAPLIQ